MAIKPKDIYKGRQKTHRTAKIIGFHHIISLIGFYDTIHRIIRLIHIPSLYLRKLIQFIAPIPVIKQRNAIVGHTSHYYKLYTIQLAFPVISQCA